LPDAGLDRADDPPFDNWPAGDHDPAGRGWVEELEGRLAREDRRTQVGHDDHPGPPVRTTDRGCDAVRVGADRTVRRTADCLERDLITRHLAGKLDHAFGEAAGVRDDNDPDVRRNGPGLGQRS
jgi:hypothetical protein